MSWVNSGVRTRWAALALLLLLSCLLLSCEPAGEQPPEGRVPGGAAEVERSNEESSAPIVVEAPQPGEELTSPAVISGTADVFEATVSYRIVGPDGRIIKRGFTTASCGSGCRGDFSVTVPFVVDEPTPATIELFEESAESGKPQHQVELEVTLLP